MQDGDRADENDTARTPARVPSPWVLRSPSWWMGAGAVFTTLTFVTLLNGTVYPSFSGLFLGARDLSTAVGVVALVLLYLIGEHRPGCLEPHRLLATAVALACAGLPLTALSLQTGSVALLCASSALSGVWSSWFTVMSYLCLVDLTLRMGRTATFWAVFAGFAASFLGELLLMDVPSTVCVVAFVLVTFARPAMAWRGSCPVLDAASRSAPIAGLRVTNPRSYVPVGSALFITLVLLKTSFGVAVTFASNDAVPIATVSAALPVLAVLAVLGACGRTDLLGTYRAALLFVLAGFLLVSPQIESVTGIPTLANVVLRAGSDLTRVLAFLLVAYVGARNVPAAAGVALVVGAANSVGSLVGAQVGMAANAALEADPGLLSLLLAGLVFAFVAYNLLSPGASGLDRLADSVEDAPSPAAPYAHDTPTIGRTCDQISRELGLTPRETEALGLLARGHNTESIQERMTVSRSTAKTHVRNVYAKLGVHSQQELIELVEGRMEDAQELR